MGCINADNREVFYTQEKNAVETYNKYEKANDGLNHWTETCGPTSLWNGCEAMGIDIKQKGFGELLRPADSIFCYLNTYSNFSTLPPVDGCTPGLIPGNEVQKWLPLAMSALFGVDCVYREGLGFDDVVSLLKVGHAVQLARRVGHYVVAVDYDEANDLLVYWDSFGLFVGEDESLTDDGTGGFRRTMTRDFFASDLWPRFIEIVG